ncbi:hypothetical protein ACFLZV_01920 [Candidatus Margulisiibacteriota bacterium]
MSDNNQCFENAPMSLVIIENIFLLAMFISGTIGLLPFKLNGIPILSILYALFAIIMIVFVLRKHICTSCYYYDKWCHVGWGKLAAKLFKKDSGNRELGFKLIWPTWIVLMFLPVLLILVAIALYPAQKNFSLAVLGIFIITLIINNGLHFYDCKKCKMQETCPGNPGRKNNNRQT